MKLIFKSSVFKNKFDDHICDNFHCQSVISQKSSYLFWHTNFEEHAYLNNNSIIEISDLLNFESIPPANSETSMWLASRWYNFLDPFFKSGILRVHMEDWLSVLVIWFLLDIYLIFITPRQGIKWDKSGLEHNIKSDTSRNCRCAQENSIPGSSVPTTM